MIDIIMMSYTVRRIPCNPNPNPEMSDKTRNELQYSIDQA